MRLLPAIVLIVAALVWLAAAATPAWATEVLNDNFDAYSDGDLPEPPWTLYSGAGDPQVISGACEVTETGRTGDVERTLTGGPYSTGDILFAGLTVRATANPTGATYLAMFWVNSTTFRARLFVTAGGVADTVRFGISNGSAAADQTLTTDVPLNTDVSLVLRLDMTTGNAVTTLWQDPVDINSTSITAADVVAAGSVVSFAFRQSTGIGTLVLDNLKVATTFNEALPVPPNTLTIATDNPTPDPEFVTNATAGVVVGSFTAAASGATATITQLDLTAGGNGTSETDVTSVAVWRDDGSGSFESGSDSMVATGSYTGTSLSLTSLSNNTVTDGTTVRFFVVYDLSGQASQGETFTASTTVTADIAVVGDNPSVSRIIEMIVDPGGGGGGGNNSGGGGCQLAGTGSAGHPGHGSLLLLALLALAIIRRRA